MKTVKKMQMGGKMMSDSTMMKDSMMKKGGAVKSSTKTVAKKPKMGMGGSAPKTKMSSTTKYGMGGATKSKKK